MTTKISRVDLCAFKSASIPSSSCVSKFLPLVTATIWTILDLWERLLVPNTTLNTMKNFRLGSCGPPDSKSWLIGKDPDAGKDWRQEEKGTTEDEGWMASLTQWTWVWASSGRWWWTREAWRAAVHGVAKSWTWLIDWMTTNSSLKETKETR